MSEFAAPPKVLAKTRCELAGRKEGEKGAWYPVKLLAVLGSSATVRHETLDDDNGEPLKENVKTK